MIELNNISKVYNKSKANEVKVLQNIELKIEKSSMLAIMGPSGSGKSTLLNILGCLDIPSMGTYKLYNQELQSLNRRKLATIRNEHFGFVVQDFALIEDYTVMKNVEIPILYSKDKTNKKERVLSILERLGMKEKASEYAYNLSGGQRQRVAIARALINNPDIILADEPTGALDQRTGQQVLDIFKSIHQEQKKTILIVTHDDRVAKQCDGIINIVDGKVY
ncbi:ABC transporter ATP-binding protein [Bacillus thuringiensis]|uniref:ABC transporter ATP-binding protein n=1 Tax=Bacillus cereus TaxID=1396 RepID=A0A9W7Q343_BACCE|nr:MULTISPECIES: ABC transporter ATP-binding protein [Bacillus]AXR15322.1 ABC transporter ATP-binding protein [Bacillus sp. CR71]AXR21056.1 ABC transporter ATP-binding protein [Bacillus sp. E25]KAA6460818.1 ABC transporter ATP-binding protein [Bacillus cereus]KAB2392666.1 ABC transporter ATP-binding protein [Bacillus cereus]KAB2419010.1 ABC transporter ATP-binding protein [Bacillus cereus]